MTHLDGDTIMKVKHFSLSPVHIIGHGRSGTSILAGLIRKYLGISFGTESQFIIRYYKRLEQYGDLKKDSNLKKLIHDISKERCFYRWRKFDQFKLDSNRFLNDICERSYRGVLDAAFLQLARHSRMERWGDKTPEYVFNLPVLKELFPDALFIHIVRDGRDVALSSYKHGLMGVQNSYMAAKQWRESILKVKEFEKSLSPDQYMEFRYEDFIDNPVEIFSRLIDFLQINDSDGTLFEFISKNIVNDVKPGNYNKWKKDFSYSQRLLYEETAADMLQAYGYETVVKEIRHLSALEKMRWFADNQIRRMAIPKYWRDNIYKLNLRLKSLLG
jgi:hypothetical protein